MSSFHLTCAVMGALGKKMRCSGFEEVLIESGICASGLIEQVLTGKNYNHALCVHKVVCEALERILLQVYESLHGCLFDTQGVTTLHHLAKNWRKHSLLECLASESCNKSLDRYDKFKGTVRQGALGKTAQFWLSSIERLKRIACASPSKPPKNVQHVFQLRSPKLCKMLCILLVEYVEPGRNASRSRGSVEE